MEIIVEKHTLCFLEETEERDRVIISKIRKHANQMLYMWGRIIKNSKGDILYKKDERQAYQDALTSMKSCGLIDSYNVANNTVVISDNLFKLNNKV